MKRTLTVVTGAVVAMLFTGPAQASERDGVSCPSGTDARVSNGVLKCSVTLEYQRASTCPGVDFPDYTQIEHRGVDQCKPQVAPLQGRASVNSTMTPLSNEPRITRLNRTIRDPMVLSTVGVIAPNPPPDSAYQRRTDPIGQDQFLATQVVYLWPVGIPMPSTAGHDPEQGVACPSGASTEVLDDRRRLLCIDAQVHQAGCDSVNPFNPRSPWTIERRAGRDFCVSKDSTGNFVSGQYTIPTNVGYLGVMGNPAQRGWTLHADRNGKADYWVKNDRAYKYPVAR